MFFVFPFFFLIGSVFPSFYLVLFPFISLFLLVLLGVLRLPFRLTAGYFDTKTYEQNDMTTKLDDMLECFLFLFFHAFVFFFSLIFFLIDIGSQAIFIFFPLCTINAQTVQRFFAYGGLGIGHANVAMFIPFLYLIHILFARANRNEKVFHTFSQPKSNHLRGTFNSSPGLSTGRLFALLASWVRAHHPVLFGLSFVCAFFSCWTRALQCWSLGSLFFILHSKRHRSSRQ